MHPNIAKWYEGHARLASYENASQIFEKHFLPHIKVSIF